MSELIILHYIIIFNLLLSINWSLKWCEVMGLNFYTFSP